MQHWQSLIDTAFYAIVSSALGLAVKFLCEIGKSISELNKRIAVVIEKLADHDYRIQRLEQGDKK